MIHLSVFLNRRSFDMRRFRLLPVAALMVAVVLLSGCGQGSSTSAVAKKDVQSFGLAYVEFLGEKKASPKGIDDLAAKKSTFGKLPDQIKDGTFVVVWNATLSQNGNENDKLVIGHEKNAADKGGLVLFGGGTVEQLTADAFKKETVAKSAP
jgi:hypothetical protein